MSVIPQPQGMEFAIEAAARWAAEQEPAVPFAPDTLHPIDSVAYEPFELARTAADVPLRAEIVGDSERKTLLLLGFDGSTRHHRSGPMRTSRGRRAPAAHRRRAFHSGA